MRSSLSNSLTRVAKKKKLSWMLHLVLSRVDVIGIILIYIICHLPLILLWDAKYWDDWLIFGLTEDQLIQTFSEAGLTLFSSFHLILRSWGAEGYKLFSFLAFLIPSIASIYILRAVGLSRRKTFWTAALISTLPFFFSRVAAINAPSALFLALFFIAWVLLLNNSRGLKGLMIGSASAILFSISFFYHSLASFYMVALATFFYARRFDSGWLTLRNTLAIVPIIAFIIQRLSFAPSGNYAGYNSMSLSLSSLVSTLFSTGVEFLNPSSPPGAFLLFFVAPIVFFGAYFSSLRRFALFRRLRFHLFSIIAILFAIAPYLIAGKYPSFIDWGSRLQLLLPFGVSLLFVESCQRIHAYLRLRSNLHLPFFLFPLICVLFSITLWWSNYIDYEVDWIKQQSIVEDLKRQPDLATYNVFIVMDGAAGLNAAARSYRFYEVAGMLREAEIYSAEIIATQFEIQSSIKRGNSWAQFRLEMDTFINENYLLRRSKASERIALLNITSMPMSGISKTRLATEAWFLQITGRGSSVRLLNGVIFFHILDISTSNSYFVPER
jgi:hypothetical protein